MAEVVLTEEEKMIIEKKLLQQDLMRAEEKIKGLERKNEILFNAAERSLTLQASIDKEIKDLKRKEAFNSKRIANLTRKYICPQCDELPKGRRCIFADNHDEDLCDKSGYKKGFAYED